MGRQARNEAHDRDVTLAWTMAALERQKRLPALKTLLAKRDERQNVKQMRTTLQLLSEAYRIPLRTKH